MQTSQMKFDDAALIAEYLARKQPMQCPPAVAQGAKVDKSIRNAITAIRKRFEQTA